MMKISLLTIVLSVLVVGCSSNGKRYMSDDEGLRMKNASVTVVIKKTPTFKVLTPAIAVTQAALGGGLLSAMMADGLSADTLLEKNALTDPALQISEAMQRSLEKAHNASVVRVLAFDASQKTHATTYTLELETEKWGLKYFTTETTMYGVNYEARARLYSNKNKTLVAEGACKEKTELRDNIGTFKEIESGQSPKLKNELARIAQSCIYALRADMLIY